MIFVALLAGGFGLTASLVGTTVIIAIAQVLAIMRLRVSSLLAAAAESIAKDGGRTIAILAGETL